MLGKNPEKLYNKNFNLLISEQCDYSISGLFACLCLFFFSCVLSEKEKVAPHSYQLGAILALMTERWGSPEECKQFHTFVWDCDTVRQT